jgi:hypothetical protein
MKRLAIAVLILSVLVLASAGCAANRRYDGELRGLMLQDNLKLGRNKAYYSKHNIQTKKEAYRKYRKGNKYYVLQRR